MARTKNTRRGKKKPAIQKTEISTDDSEKIEQLVQQAEQLLISSDFDQAKNVCEQVLQLQSDHIKALENMALCELELGRVKSSRNFFLKCLNHSQQNPEPTVHLYLAQLAGSPKEALSHYTSALDLLKSKLDQILQAKITKENPEHGQTSEMNSENQATTLDNNNSNTTVHWSIDESQIRRSCSRALVAMTEIYLTDLCFDSSAEAKCLEYLAMASSLDPTDPEPLQTLASVRLSQSEDKLAKEALLLSWSLWKDKALISKEKTDQPEEKIDLDQDQAPNMDLNEQEDDKKEDGEEEKANQMMETFDSKMVIEDDVLVEEEREEQNGLPPIESRISWAKLAIECDMWNSAIEVLQQCEAEDDEDGEIQYLLAIAWFLLGQSRPQDPAANQPDPQPSNQTADCSIAVGDGLSQIECWLEAQEAIETCFQLHERLGEASGLDKSIFQHIQELKQEFKKAGLAPIHHEDDQKNDFDESLIDDDDWVDASDVEMG